MTNKPWIVVLCGVPGSGKSTWTQREFFPYLIAGGIYAEMLSSDEIIEYCAAGVNKKYGEVFKDLISAASAVITSRLKISSFIKVNICLDQTNLNEESRKRKIESIYRPEDYHKIAIYFEESKKTIIERNTKRNSGAKEFSTELLSEMMISYKRPKIEEGFDEVLSLPEFKLKYMPVIKGKEDDSTTIISGESVTA